MELSPHVNTSYNPLDELENLPPPSSQPVATNEQTQENIVTNEKKEDVETQNSQFLLGDSKDFFSSPSSSQTSVMTPNQENVEQRSETKVQEQQHDFSPMFSENQTKTQNPPQYNSNVPTFQQAPREQPSWYQSHQQLQPQQQQPQVQQQQSKPVSSSSSSSTMMNQSRGNVSENFRGYPSVENSSDLFSFAPQQKSEEKFLSYPQLPKSESKPEMSAPSWNVSTERMQTSQHQPRQYPPPQQFEQQSQHHFPSQIPHPQALYYQGNMYNQKQDESVQYMAQTKQMFEQVTNQFGKMMNFLESIDKRLSKLESVTQDILDQKKAESLQYESLMDTVNQQMSQLEADRDLAKKLQEEFDQEVKSVKSSSSSISTKTYMDEIPKKSFPTKSQSEIDEEYARKLQEQFNREAEEEEEDSKTTQKTESEEKSSGVLSRWFGGKKKESEKKEQTTPLIKKDYTQPPKTRPSPQQMVPYPGSHLMTPPPPGYQVYRPGSGYQPGYYPMVGHVPHPVYYPNMAQPQNKK